jgi:uncharacterized membrane protein
LRGWPHALIAVIFVSFLPATAVCAAQFSALPLLLPGDSTSFAYAISSDGRLVIGEDFSAKVTVHGEATAWSYAAGIWAVKGLGLPTALPGALNSPAGGLSIDGALVVGRSSFEPPANPPVDTYAWCWRDTGGFKLLPMPSGLIVAQAVSTTEGGTTIVGFASPDVYYRQDSRPIVWRGSYVSGWAASQLDSSEGWALAVDMTGNRVVGWSRPSTADPSIPAGQARFAAMWSFVGGSWTKTWLGSLPGDGGRGSVSMIAPRGHFALGSSGTLEASRPAMWNLLPNGKPTKVDDLGMLPKATLGIATAATPNGRRVVGYCSRLENDEFRYEAFLWERGTGIRSLRELLIAGGANEVAAWMNLAATGISEDGNTICGYGTDPSGPEGHELAWVARLK